MASPPDHGLFIVERILRDRDGVWRQINARQDIGALLKQMFISSVVSLALYGAVLGSSKGWLQAASSTVKLPVLFLATLAICLPTLYLFNLVFGARLMMSQAVALIMVCITVTSVLTLAFAPISLFFRITAQSYGFFKLLNVSILLLTAVVGLRFLTAGMRALNEYNAMEDAAKRAAAMRAATVEANQAAIEAAPAVVEPVPVTVGAPTGNGAVTPATATQPAAAQLAPGELDEHRPLPVARPVGISGRPAPQPREASMTLLYVWIMLFGFVGTQLAWTLRPFFGSPSEPFEIFRNIEGTFYGDVLRTIGNLLSG